LLEKFLGSKVWDVSAVCNGILGGLVSITAGAATISTPMALLAGFLGGFVYFGTSKLLLKLKVDDPLDAFAVHGACGFWGVLANGLFADPTYSSGFYAWGPAGHDYDAAFFGGGKLLGACFTALIVEIAWVGTLSFLMFFGLSKAKLLRVTDEEEDAGMDSSKHGGTAYNMGVPNTAMA